jgi:hypothetical protein
MSAFDKLPGVRKPGVEDYQKALALALKMLAPHEPPDSRNVSEEFVALACIQNQQCSDNVMLIIDRALAREES